MERKSSRRRTHRIRDASPAMAARNLDARDTGSSSFRRNTQYGLLRIVLLLLLFLSVYLGYQRGKDDNLFKLPFSSYHNGNDIHGNVELGNFQAYLLLHPEQHVSRPPKIQDLSWRVSAGYRRPDGVLTRVYLVNDRFPGPTVEARSGDTMTVLVKNDLMDESVSIHWHGLHMRNANTMDGVPGVTQCDIQPGASFTYNFTAPADQSGTFWYHAHSSVQRADGLYGGFIVHKPSTHIARGPPDRDDPVSYGYQKEILLLIGDWYHRPAREILSWYMRAGSFGNEPVPDSLIINGVGHFNCSNAVPARPVDCTSARESGPKLNLNSEITYRARVVNTGSLAGFTLVFGRETLELIELDGGNKVEPRQSQGATSAGILFPGQRMDLVVYPPVADESSSITVELDQGCFRYPNPALEPQQSFLITRKNSKGGYSIPAPDVLPPANERDHIDVGKVSSPSSILASLPPKAQQTHVVYTKIEKLARNHNMPYGFFNRTSWHPQRDPPMPLVQLPRRQWDKNQLSIVISPELAWVDLVVNNLDEGSHPFHLHGYDFYILAIHESTMGWGSYNPFKDRFPPGISDISDISDSSRNSHANENNSSDRDAYDLTLAIRRDTVQIPRRGYAVLRFRADNPGVWLFHCHILWHLASGMAMLVDVLGDEAGLIPHQKASSASTQCHFV